MKKRQLIDRYKKSAIFRKSILGSMIIGLTIVFLVFYHFRGQDKINQQSCFAGKNIVSVGDSIFAYNQGDTSISYHLSKLSGAICYNCAFGGAMLSDEGEIPNYISFPHIADCICKQDFSDIEQYVDSLEGVPEYFTASTIPLLKKIDFDTIDILTVEYGTNDYNAGKRIDNEVDKYDTETVCGALRYGIKELNQRYPGLDIIVITPIWRYYANGVQCDSDRGGVV